VNQLEAGDRPAKELSDITYALVAAGGHLGVNYHTARDRMRRRARGARTSQEAGKRGGLGALRAGSTYALTGAMIDTVARAHSSSTTTRSRAGMFAPRRLEYGTTRCVRDAKAHEKIYPYSFAAAVHTRALCSLQKPSRHWFQTNKAAGLPTKATHGFLDRSHS
jgi:hypothetical protein